MGMLYEYARDEREIMTGVKEAQPSAPPEPPQPVNTVRYNADGTLTVMVQTGTQ